MKKLTLFGIILLTAMLTSCKEYREGDVTGVPIETTSLTLTEEIIPEKNQDGEELPKEITLAVYNPFSKSLKADFTTDLELRAAVEKIDNARLLLTDNYSVFENTYYVDYGVIIEGDENSVFTYSPFNPKIAENEEQLFDEVRKYFTENYITDEELKKRLFEDDHNDPPRYRTIDGTLCARCGYDGVAPQIYNNKVYLLSDDGERAEVAVEGVGVDEYYHVYIGLVKNGNIWQADSIDYRPYNEEFVNIVKTGFLSRQKNINNILGGGSVPPNPKTIEIDGESYTETRLTMTVAEMKEFFKETFRSTYPKWIEPYKLENCGEICDEYIQKYIDDVYAERDGTLYRKDSEPKRYLPEIKFDPYGDYKGRGGNDYEGYYILDGEFFDGVKNESFAQDISISFTYDWDGHEYKYYGVYIASELPIKELE